MPTDVNKYVIEVSRVVLANLVYFVCMLKFIDMRKICVRVKII